MPQDRVTIKSLRKIIAMLAFFASKEPVGNTIIVQKQIKIILDSADKKRYLDKLKSAFATVDLKAITDYLDAPQKPHNLKNAFPFVFFLTNDVPPVQEKDFVEYQGPDMQMRQGGMANSQLEALELARPKAGKDDLVMSVDYLDEHKVDLPAPTEAGEAEMRRNATEQRESGAYTAEDAQNPKDALQGADGEMTVEFYTQINPNTNRKESVEIGDNGPGAQRAAKWP